MIFKRVSKIYIPIYLNFLDEAKYIRNESILLFKGDNRRQKEDSGQTVKNITFYSS